MPNIDRLASQGMRLQSYHNCQNCAPTRAALMSGQYASRTGVYTVGGIDRFDWRSRPLRPVDNVTDLPLDKITVAQALKRAGYATGMFGKWHLGQRDEYHPAQRGFDEAIVSNGKHFDFTTQPKTDYPKGQYLADFLTDKAVDFIARQKDSMPGLSNGAKQSPPPCPPPTTRGQSQSPRPAKSEIARSRVSDSGLHGTLTMPIAPSRRFLTPPSSGM